MAAREAARIMKEATFGVFNPAATPVKNTDFVNLEMSRSGSMTVRQKPRLWGPIRTMDTWNRRVKRGTARGMLEGAITTYFYPEQAGFFASLATLTGTLLNKLPSFSIDHMVRMEDDPDTPLYARYLGCVAEQWKLEATDGDGDAVLFKLTINVKGQKLGATIDDTDFPDPVDADFPAGNPFQISHMVSPGYLRLAQTTDGRPEFAGFDLTVKNIIDPVFFESPFPTRMKWCGRDVDWTDKLAFVSNADRASFEAQTPLACSARIDNGTKSVTMALRANNVISGVEDDHAMEKVFLQNLTWENQYDRAASDDFTITVA